MKKKTLMRRLRNELINGEILAELLMEGEEGRNRNGSVCGFLMFMFWFFFFHQSPASSATPAPQMSPAARWTRSTG